MIPNIRFLTERGFRVFLIVLGCAGLAALFVDPFLGALAVGITGFIFYDYKKAKDGARGINNLIKLNSNNIKEVLVAGQSKRINLSYESNTNLQVNLSSPLKQVQLRPSRVRKGKHILELLLFSDVSGNYTADRIGAKVLGPYRLTKKGGNISFNLNLKVFPRVMVALIQAALFLLRGGRGGAGDVPIPFKGPGTEYADTREYVPGDSLHHIDWKATARHGRLMVKEFFLEAGRGAYIIYDTRAVGPISQDKLATNFLNTCLGVVEQGYPVGVTIHNGEKVLLHSIQDSPREVLKMAMGYVLQSMRVDLEDVDILIDPSTSSQIRRFLNKVKEESVKKVLEFEAKIIQNKLKQPYKFLAQLSRQINEPRQFLLISQLSDEVVDILQFADEIQSRHQLTIIQPTQPWREAENLEKAYQWYERVCRIKDILARHKVRLVSRLSS